VPASLAAWLVCGLLIALLAGRLAWIIQVQWAPFFFFPLLCGAAMGAGLLALKLCLPAPTRRSVLIIAVMTGLAFSAAGHCFAYRQYVRNYEQTRQKHPQVALLEQAVGEIKPMGFIEFLSVSARERTIGPWQVHGLLVWLSWLLDAVLVIAAATAVASINPRAAPGDLARRGVP
jgi:hypothetical protein